MRLREATVVLAFGAGLLTMIGCANNGQDRHAGHGEDVHATGEHPAPAEVGMAKAGTAQTTCPVMGDAINKNIYADHMGKRVYFCCNACPAEFKKDPMKYIKKLEDSGVVLEKVAGEAADSPHGAGM